MISSSALPASIIALMRPLSARSLLWDHRAVDHLQRLRQVRFARPFALAGHFALRLTEDLQEVVIRRRIGQLRGPGAERHAGELLRHVGHGADRVEQLLGGEQPGRTACEL